MIMRALRAALAVDLIVLPSIGVPGLASIEGGVLRYEASGDPKAVKRAVYAALERYSAGKPPRIEHRAS